MPHTFAHPFFAAPLKRLMPRALRTSGLVLGSMAPDFEYFIAMEPHRTIGHTYAGFFLIHLPLCAAAVLVLERLLLPTLPLLLPAAGGLDRFAAERAKLRPLRTAADWLAFAVSLFIGFLTHLFMDGWTHDHTFITDRLAWLHEPFIGGNVIYEWLQFVFSALGAGAIALYAWHRWRIWKSSREAGGEAPLCPPGDKRRFRLAVFTVMAAALAAKVVIDPPVSQLGAANVAPVSAFAAGWLIAALALRHKGAAWAAALALLAVMAGHSRVEWQVKRMLLGVIDHRLYKQVQIVCWVAALWGVCLIIAGCAFYARRNRHMPSGASSDGRHDWTRVG